MAVTNNYQPGRYGHQDDPHRQEPRRTIISQGISAGHGQNGYRGLVKILKRTPPERETTHRCELTSMGDNGPTPFAYIKK